MALPTGRAAPDEVFETFAEDTPEEVMALADAEPEPAPTPAPGFEGFVAGVRTDTTTAVAEDADDSIDDLDIDELFG
ncbi:hypothetical protein [Haloarchaeobius sp. DFWS5]|uniref:hypothetical protein n=1 Tax=Haloarchaeobius sp. DFWS5 TaxID=3446114 RepID=UPI003EBD0AE5